MVKEGSAQTLTSCSSATRPTRGFILAADLARRAALMMMLDRFLRRVCAGGALPPGWRFWSLSRLQECASTVCRRGDMLNTSTAERMPLTCAAVKALST